MGRMCAECFNRQTETERDMKIYFNWDAAFSDWVISYEIDYGRCYYDYCFIVSNAAIKRGVFEFFLSGGARDFFGVGWGGAWLYRVICKKDL